MRAGTVHDVLIIGAGAAGIAAARRLRAAGLACLLIEARGRPGGRAHSVDLGPGIVDFGAEWLHSADVNPLVGLARELGFTVETGEANWGGHAGAGFPAAERKLWRDAANRFWDAVDGAAEGPDRPAADFLDPGSRWNGLIQAVSGWYNGVELESVSTADLGRYEDTMVNWRLTQGYGALIAAAGAGLPAVFEAPALCVRHGGAEIIVETPRGTLTGRSAIVTVSSALIAQDVLAFDPPLPDKRAAAAALPLGLANKIFFAFDGPAEALPQDGHLYGAIDRAEIVSFELRRAGAPLVSGFVGGAFANAMEGAGDAAFADEARRQFAAMLGADLAGRLRFLAATRWRADVFARGAYSYGRVGAGGAREKLAEPVGDNLFFAGEATSRHRFSTVHGAWESGERAAGEAIRVLKNPNVII